MKLWSKEIIIALCALIAIVVLFFGIKFLKGQTMLTNTHTYYILFNHIDGLTTSNPVYANGYKVGTVQNIKYDYEHPGNILVALDLDRGLKIPEGSSAEIESDFMGNLKLNLIFSVNEQLLHPGDTIKGQLQLGTLQKAAELIPTIQAVLPKVDSIMTHLNAILSDPSIKNTLHNAEHISNDLTTSTQQLNTLLAKVNHDLPPLMEQAKHVMGNADNITSDLAQANLKQTIDQLEQTIDNIKAISNKLNSNDNSLGLLLNDKQLYDNLNKTVNSADTLLNNIREHPKRYVNFSVFGKKDK